VTSGVRVWPTSENTYLRGDFPSAIDRDLSRQPSGLAFHREVVMPDIQRLVGDLEKRMDARFDEVNGRFDVLAQRLDRFETGWPTPRS
jgi:hypothetical protein